MRISGLVRLALMLFSPFRSINLTASDGGLVFGLGGLGAGLAASKSEIDATERKYKVPQSHHEVGGREGGGPHRVRGLRAGGTFHISHAGEGTTLYTTDDSNVTPSNSNGYAL